MKAKAERSPREAVEMPEIIKQTIHELRNRKPLSREVEEFAKEPIERLFEHISREISEKQPKNVVAFLIEFLCKHYPQHLHGFGKIVNSDPELEENRSKVVAFFNFMQLPLEVASHFIESGFDTLDTLATLTAESLDDIESFAGAQWLSGHKIRLLQMFQNIQHHIEEFKTHQLYAASKLGPRI